MLLGGNYEPDNCMGSGTTGVACKNTDRNFIGIEKDPIYFETAKSRLNQL
jgi:site-specific DNA-methyltransferase (adenine-specific)